MRDLRQGALPAALDEKLKWIGEITPLINEGLKGNPRQVKRFLNALVLRKQLGELAWRAVDDAILVKLMLLVYSRPELFDELYTWQMVADGKPPELRHLESTARSLLHRVCLRWMM